jgi:hypothetical protein
LLLVRRQKSNVYVRDRLKLFEHLYLFFGSTIAPRGGKNKNVLGLALSGAES